MSAENINASKIVAQNGTAADFIRLVKAEAWDEGYGARKRQAAQNPSMGVPGHEAPVNPYREES